MDFNTIIKVIKDAQSIIISAHTNPDGDAIGAMVAVGHICAYYNKPYTILIEQPLVTYKHLLQDISHASHLESGADTFIALDCGDKERLVGYEAYFKEAIYTINIDHHVTNTSFAQYNYIDAKASSTSELVYRLIEEAQIPLNRELAAALYTGILTDTGGFMHSSTNPSTHLMAAELIKLPFNFSALYEKTLQEKTIETAKLQAQATSHMKQLAIAGIYLSHITSEEVTQIGASKEDMDGVISYLKTIKGVKLIAFIYPKEGQEHTYKLSMRSNPPYNVAAFCQSFGGGGHERAAGATLEGKLEEVLERVEQAVSTFVKS